jgi:hypothetical protein
MKKQILNEEFARMQKLAGLITESECKSNLNEEYSGMSTKQISDYWSIMVDNQPNDVKKILTDLTMGKLSYDNFISNTSDDVYDSFKDEMYDDEDQLNENEYEDDEDEDFDLNQAFKDAPNEALYREVLKVFKEYNDDSIIEDFKDRFPKEEPVSKDDYSEFAMTLIDDMSEVDFIQANWISIFDEDIYEKAGLV